MFTYLGYASLNQVGWKHVSATEGKQIKCRPVSLRKITYLQKCSLATAGSVTAKKLTVRQTSVRFLQHHVGYKTCYGFLTDQSIFFEATFCSRHLVSYVAETFKDKV